MVTGNTKAIQEKRKRFKVTLAIQLSHLLLFHIFYITFIFPCVFICKHVHIIRLTLPPTSAIAVVQTFHFPSSNFGPLKLSHSTTLSHMVVDTEQPMIHFDTCSRTSNTRRWPNRRPASYQPAVPQIIYEPLHSKIASTLTRSIASRTFRTGHGGCCHCTSTKWRIIWRNTHFSAQTIINKLHTIPFARVYVFPLQLSQELLSTR